MVLSVLYSLYRHTHMYTLYYIRILQHLASDDPEFYLYLCVWFYSVREKERERELYALRSMLSPSFEFNTMIMSNTILETIKCILIGLSVLRFGYFAQAHTQRHIQIEARKSFLPIILHSAQHTLSFGSCLICKSRTLYLTTLMLKMFQLDDQTNIKLVKLQ